ncbi:hypothetical protein PTKIN_Ptkin06aG0146300 [Pterospermum kingtungense]
MMGISQILFNSSSLLSNFDNNKEGFHCYYFSKDNCPNFCLSHTRHHQTNGFLTPTALILKWYYTLPSEFDVVPLKHNSRVPFFDYMNHAPNINVMQSFYGLFLCESVIDGRQDIIFSVAFDPLKSPHYKIICVCELVYDEKYELDVYSSQTDSWSLSRISFPLMNTIRFEDAVFCDGKIHWISYWKDSLYFDVEHERLEPLPMPVPTLAPEERHYFGECRGVLYIAVAYFVLECVEFDIFEMASDYSHWFLKHRLYIGDIEKDIPEIMKCFDPYSPSYDLSSPGFTDVCITLFEKEEEPRVVVWFENKVIFYDFKEGAWKSLYDLKPALVDVNSWDRSCHYFDFILPYQSVHAFQYFENLSSI